MLDQLQPWGAATVSQPFADKAAYEHMNAAADDDFEFKAALGEPDHLIQLTE